MKFMKTRGQCAILMCRLSLSTTDDGIRLQRRWRSFRFDRLISVDAWQAKVREALRIALVNLEAVPAPAGTMDVVLGPGWPGSFCTKPLDTGWRVTLTEKDPAHLPD